MILQGQGLFGKRLIVWTNEDTIKITMRGLGLSAADVSATFPLEEALRFFLGTASEIAERMRQRQAAVTPQP